MSWHEPIFAYCERASDPDFWAEPFNAISNAAFLVAALLAGRLYLKRQINDPTIACLIGLIGLIGFGSFLFHTIATRWSALADVVPIAIFTLIYMVFALRRFAGLSSGIVALLMGLYLATVTWTFTIDCKPDWLPATAIVGRNCLNGSVIYLPTLVSLLVLLAILAIKRHRTAVPILLATIVFSLSLSFRTLDYELCDQVHLLGASRGTHALWHILNAALLYILARTAIYDVRPLFDVARTSESGHKGRHADVVESVDTQDLKS